MHSRQVLSISPIMSPWRSPSKMMFPSYLNGEGNITPVSEVKSHIRQTLVSVNIPRLASRRVSISVSPHSHLVITSRPRLCFSSYLPRPLNQQTRISPFCCQLLIFLLAQFSAVLLCYTHCTHREK